MTVPEFTVYGNYRRALIAAANHDRRQLVKQLRSGVPLSRADMEMLADYIERRLRPLSTKPAHRPRRTARDFAYSDDPRDVATRVYWERERELRASGNAYGKLGALSDEIAAEFQIDPAAFPSIRTKRRRFRLEKPARK